MILSQEQPLDNSSDSMLPLTATPEKATFTPLLKFVKKNPFVMGIGVPIFFPLVDSEKRAAFLSMSWAQLHMQEHPLIWVGTGKEICNLSKIRLFSTLFVPSMVYVLVLLGCLAVESHRYWLAEGAAFLAWLFTWRLVVLNEWHHHLKRICWKTDFFDLHETAIKSLGYEILFLLLLLGSCGLAWPLLSRWRLYTWFNQLWFGKRKINCRPIPIARLYRGFLPLWLIGLATGAGVSIIIYPWLCTGMSILVQLDDPYASQAFGTILYDALRLGWPALAVLAVWLFLVFILWGVWCCTLWQAAISALRLSGLVFDFHPGRAQLVGLILMTLLLKILSFGLLSEFLRWHWLEFIAKTLKYNSVSE